MRRNRRSPAGLRITKAFAVAKVQLPPCSSGRATGRNPLRDKGFPRHPARLARACSRHSAMSGGPPDRPHPAYGAAKPDLTIRWQKVRRPKWRFRSDDLLRGLVERRAASVAQARPVPAQAGGDRPNIGDFTRAEAVDIRRTGAALLGRTLILCERGAASEQRQEQAERAALAGATGKRGKSEGSRLHGGVSRIRLAQRVRLC